jgi:hypothetical protein
MPTLGVDSRLQELDVLAMEVTLWYMKGHRGESQ